MVFISGRFQHCTTIAEIFSWRSSVWGLPHGVCRKVDNCATRGWEMARGFVPTEFGHTPTTNAELCLAEATKRQAMFLNFDVSSFRTAA